MDRVSIRQLRNDVSRIVRRASAGERLVITSNGVAVAEIRPLETRSSDLTLDELIEAGLVDPPRTRAKAETGHPTVFGGPSTSDEILREHRRDRL